MAPIDLNKVQAKAFPFRQYFLKGDFMQIVFCVKRKDKSVDCWLDGRLIAHFPAHYTNKPDRRYKAVTINCCKYLINWG